VVICRKPRSGGDFPKSLLLGSGSVLRPGRDPSRPEKHGQPNASQLSTYKIIPSEQI
jgi:hypothetical protein